MSKAAQEKISASFCSPETCGDRPRIVGTRISVQQIATLHRQGLSVTDIIAEYEFLNLAQVYAALAYYYANQTEIEAYLIRYNVQRKCK